MSFQKLIFRTGQPVTVLCISNKIKKQINFPVHHDN